MRLCWNDTIERWRHGSTLDVYPAARTLAGADADLLRQLCGSVALDTLAVIQHNVDYGSDPSDDEPDKHTGWALVEIDPKADEPTGVKLRFLHESGLLADPRGREGSDLWKSADAALGIEFASETWRERHDP
jgi:hypothetical protein